MVAAGHSIPALIRDDLTTLPPAHYASLRLLLGLLAAVAARSATNKASGALLRERRSCTKNILRARAMWRLIVMPVTSARVFDPWW